MGHFYKNLQIIMTYLRVNKIQTSKIMKTTNSLTLKIRTFKKQNKFIRNL